MKLLNYEEIVDYSESPLLVLAGPGTGKTYLLADRVTRLLKKGISKENITVLTFGKDASENMKNMFLDPNEKFKLSIEDLPTISTMHSLGYNVILEKPQKIGLKKTNLQVQSDESIKKLLFRDAAHILNLNEKNAKEAINCKQKGNCLKDQNKDTCKICAKYWEIMSKCNYIDFDDQILFANEILKNNKELLEKYQNKSQHLLIDEYQDINQAQFNLIELISEKHTNGLFAVGDDAQSIYGFRGCSPKFILRFEHDFPSAETTTLTSSRRCHENIMKDAFKILENCYNDWAGEPDLEYIAEIDKEPIAFILPNEDKEARFVALLSLKALREDKSVLILVPKKEFIPTIIDQLDKLNIPYNCSTDLVPKRVRMIKNIFNWKEGKNNNFDTRVIIEYLINNGISKIPGASKNLKLCKKETVEKRIASEKEIANIWEEVNRKKSLFKQITSKKQDKVLKKLSAAIIELNELLENQNRQKKGFLESFMTITGIWNKPKNLSDDISKVINSITSREPQVYKLVKISTMRKAKGLSFDIVFMIGLENDIVPNPRGDFAEEARLFYVSMTRTKKRLFLIHSHKRPRNISYGEELLGKERSQFLDILNKKSEWKKV